MKHNIENKYSKVSVIYHLLNKKFENVKKNIFVELISKCNIHHEIGIISDNRLSSADVKDIMYLEECINKEKNNIIYSYKNEINSLSDKKNSKKSAKSKLFYPETARNINIFTDRVNLLII